MELLRLGLENIGHRLAISQGGIRALGRQRWYWRLGYALWLEGLIGGGHRDRARGWSEEDLLYGETPPWTAHRLLEAADLQSGETLVEVGCGRAVTCLVAELAFAARAIGVEIGAKRAGRALWLTRALQTQHIIIEQGDASQALPTGEVYYLTGTSWSAANWSRLAEAMALLPPGTRAISLSQPLPEADWQIIKSERLPYSWGPALTFWQSKKF